MRVGTWLAVGVWGVAGVLDAGGEIGCAAPASVPAASVAASEATPVPESVRLATARLRETAQPGANASLVIANDRYRAVFSREGLAYTPRVDGRLESRLAWTYRARTVATDTATRRLDAVAPAVSVTGEHVVDFIRPGLVERYEGEGAAVEQIFVLSERPAGRGDVRIEGDVTFNGRMTAANGGLRFEAAGLPAFSYAAPIAFDADEKRIPVRVDASGSTLALVLDGAALDGARWPVTIDPLLGVTQVDATGNSTSGTDIAYSARRGEFLVVYDAKNALDPDLREIRLRRYYEDGNPVGSAVVLSTVAGQVYDYGPRIACDEIVDRCLVVWQRDTAVSRVRAQLLTSNGALVGAQFAPGPFTVNNYPALQERGPKVFARQMRPHAAADASFLVTWNEYNASNAYYAQFARVSGTGVPLGESQASAFDYASVDAAYDPFVDRFLAVWRGPAGALAARTVNPANGATAAVSVTDEETGGARVTFDLASRRYLVAWQEPNAFTAPIGQFMTSGTIPVPVGAPVWLTTWGSTSQDVTLRSVIAQNGTIVTTYTRWLASTGESRMARIASTGALLEDTILEAGGTPGLAFFGRMAVSVSGYLATVGDDDQTGVELNNRGRRAPGMVQGAAHDFDGDGLGDLYIYRPSTGRFFVRKSASAPPFNLAAFTLGAEAHLPVVLDWDGDALADIGVFDIASGRWRILVSSTGQQEVFSLGRGGDVLVPGNYVGGVADEAAVWRPSTGEWFIRERSSAAVFTGVLGAPGDQPVPADDDNDGLRELRVFRPSTGAWQRVELNGTGFQSATFGQVGDTAFGGNFVGGVETDLATFREGFWHIQDGGTAVVTTLPGSTPIPVVLDWDGDGLLDVGTWNEVSGSWQLIASGLSISINFGLTGDLPAGGQ